MSHTSSSDEGPRASRLIAARQLLNRIQLRESASLSPQPWARLSLVAGGQTALTMLIALPLVYTSAWAHLIGFASLGGLVALFGRFAPQAQRRGILLRCALWQVFAVFSTSMVAWFGAPLNLQIIVLAVGCGLSFYIAISGRFGPPGPLIFVFAASASIGDPVSLTHVLQATAATAIVAALALLICWCTDRLRGHLTPDMGLPSEPVPTVRHRLMAAARIAMACWIAAALAVALGADHPAWAAMGALAVMQASQLHMSMNRSVQRMVGTTVGALLVGLLLAQAPTIWSVIGILLVLIVTTEVVIGFNYGLGQMFVTPLALLMTYLAQPQSAASGMTYERILDTLLGASIGIVAAILFSTLAERTRLAQHHAGRLG